MSLICNDRIRIPWARRLRRMQRAVLPAATFFACVLSTLWLWQQQGQMPNAVGEVEAVRIDVAAGSDGIMVPLPHGQWTLFDRVEANTVIARLDDWPVKAQMNTLIADLARLRGEVTAAAEQIQIDQSEREDEQHREYRRLVWKSQRYRLDVLDRRAVIEVDRVEQKRLDNKLAFLVPLQKTGTVTKMQITDQLMKYNEVCERIKENEQSLTEAEKQLEYAETALRDYSDIRKANVDKLLLPLDAAITVGERRLDELRVLIDALEIRSPISGTICAIHGWPGQRLRAGDPILTVAADHGRYIVSYVRQEQRIRPTVGMPVDLRIRGTNDYPVATVVDRIGPQVELVPPHHRRDTSVPEWGQPIFILSPPNISLRPGELVDLTLKTQSATDSS